MIRLPGSVAMMMTGALLIAGCGGTRSAGPTDADDVATQARAFADRVDADGGAEVQWLTPSAEPVRSDPMAYQRPNPMPAATPAAAAPPRPQPQPDPAAAEATPAEPVAQAQPEALSQAELVRRLSDELADRAEATDASLKPWLARAALAAIDPTYELSVSDLATLRPADRKAVLAYQRTFSQLARSLDGDAESDRRALLNLAEELQGELAGDKSLTVRTAKLCKKVNGYGVYEPFGKNVFLAGRKQPVIVYLELDHFATRQAGEQHMVELTQEVVLYNDADGLPVWRQKPVTIRDTSRNKRRDFFVVQVVNLSERLTVGKYDMKVTVTDEVGMTVDEATIPIEVVADPALAASR